MCQKVKKVPQKVQNGLSLVFQKWAAIVVRCPIVTLCLAAICFVYIASGVRYKTKYHLYDDTPYTPKVSTKLFSYFVRMLHIDDSIFYGF